LELTEANQPLIEVELERLTSPRFSLREGFSKTDDLADSLKACGVIEPLIVRPSKTAIGMFEIICGMRRFIGAQKAGLKKVPCVVREMDDCEAIEAMLSENIQRENLTDYELGRAFKLLMEKFPDKYPNQQTIADKFKIAQPYVARLIEHYEFLEKMKGKMPPNIMPRGIMLSERVVREVRRAPEEVQPKILGALVKMFDRYGRGEEPYLPSVRDVAALVDSYVKKWEQPAGEKAEAVQPVVPSAVPKPSAPEPEPVQLPSQPPASSPRPQPVLPAPPTPPSEVEVEKKLVEVVKKRREEAKLKREEEAVVALYKYYPESFMRDVESFCGPGTSVEELQKLAYYTIEVAWDRIVDEEKLAIIREARSWME